MRKAVDFGAGLLLGDELWFHRWYDVIWSALQVALEFRHGGFR